MIKKLLYVIICVLLLTFPQLVFALEEHPLSAERIYIVKLLLLYFVPVIVVFGVVIVGARYFFEKSNFFTKIIYPTYLAGVAIFVFSLLSKLFLKDDLGEFCVAPFYAFWDHFRISFQDTKIILTLGVIIFLFGGAVYTFLKLKNTKLFLTLLLFISFLSNVLISSLTIDLTKQYDIGFWSNLKKSVSNTFLGEKPARFQIEYYWDIPKVNKNFIQDYPKLMGDYTDTSWQYLSAHSNNHPPGPAVFLWLLSKLGFDAFGQSLVIGFLGSVSLIFVYLLGKHLFDQNLGRTAAFLYTFVPAIMLYSVASLDIVFMFLSLVSFYFFFKSIAGRKILAPILAGLFFSLVFFFSFVHIFLLFFFGLLIIYYRKLIKHLPEKILFFILGFILFHGPLIVFLGYNLPLVFYLAYTARWRIPAIADERPYYYWVPWGSFIQYFTFLGLPFIWFVLLYLKKVFQNLKQKKFVPIDAIFAGTFVTYFAVNLLSRGELSRILLFVAPLFVVTLTHLISNFFSQKLRQAAILMGGIMLCETILIEIFLNTYW